MCERQFINDKKSRRIQKTVSIEIDQIHPYHNISIEETLKKISEKKRRPFF